MSVRFDAPLLEEVRRLSTQDGIKMSDWVRRAVGVAVLEASLPAAVSGFRLTGWQCPHLSMSMTTTARVMLGQASCGAGCEMTPVYEPALAA